MFSDELINVADNDLNFLQNIATNNEACHSLYNFQSKR